MLTCYASIKSVINLTYSEQLQFSHNRSEVGLNNLSLRLKKRQKILQLFTKIIKTKIIFKCS
jgi:hypothetical protein